MVVPHVQNIARKSSLMYLKLIKEVLIMKNCLEDYLTDKCGGCPFWCDGTDDRGIGCAIPAPIMSCPFYAKMIREMESEQEATTD